MSFSSFFFFAPPDKNVCIRYSNTLLKCFPTIRYIDTFDRYIVKNGYIDSIYYIGINYIFNMNILNSKLVWQLSRETEVATSPATVMSLNFRVERQSGGINESE